MTVTVGDKFVKNPPVSFATPLPEKKKVVSPKKVAAVDVVATEAAAVDDATTEEVVAADVSAPEEVVAADVVAPDETAPVVVVTEAAPVDDAITEESSVSSESTMEEQSDIDTGDTPEFDFNLPSNIKEIEKKLIEQAAALANDNMDIVEETETVAEDRKRKAEEDSDSGSRKKRKTSQDIDFVKLNEQLEKEAAEIRAAEIKAAEEKAAEEKAAEEKAAEEKAAEEKAAKIKAAEMKAAAVKKAADDKKAAEVKAAKKVEATSIRRPNPDKKKAIILDILANKRPKSRYTTEELNTVAELNFLLARLSPINTTKVSFKKISKGMLVSCVWPRKNIRVAAKVLYVKDDTLQKQIAGLRLIGEEVQLETTTATMYHIDIDTVFE